MRSPPLTSVLPVAGALLALAACSGTASSPVDLTGDAGSTKDGASPAKDSAPIVHDAAPEARPDDAAEDVAPSDDAGAEPRVYVRVKAIQTPEGPVGSSQETPSDQRVGILGITLLKTKADPAPLVVAHQATPVDTPYNGGSSTLIGSVRASDLVAGTYNFVRIPVASVRFTVAATAHADNVSLGGSLTDVICLTAGTTLDGAVRDRGWYSSTFAGGGMTYPTVTGENSAIAQPGPSSGIGLDLSGPTAAYVFPLTLVIPPAITEDMEIVFTANTYEDFHWMDQQEPGYTNGVFDVTGSSYEPVTQLGANSATVTIKPVSAP